MVIILSLSPGCSLTPIMSRTGLFLYFRALNQFQMGTLWASELRSCTGDDQRRFTRVLNAFNLHVFSFSFSSAPRPFFFCFCFCFSFPFFPTFLWLVAAKGFDNSVRDGASNEFFGCSIVLIVHPHRGARFWSILFENYQVPTKSPKSCQQITASFLSTRIWLERGGAGPGR